MTKFKSILDHFLLCWELQFFFQNDCFLLNFSAIPLFFFSLKFLDLFKFFQIGLRWYIGDVSYINYLKPKNVLYILPQGWPFFLVNSLAIAISCWNFYEQFLIFSQNVLKQSLQISLIGFCKNQSQSRFWRKKTIFFYLINQKDVKCFQSSFSFLIFRKSLWDHL